MEGRVRARRRAPNTRPSSRRLRASRRTTWRGARGGRRPSSCRRVHATGRPGEPRPSRFAPGRGHLSLLARTFAYVDEGGGQGDGPSGGAAEGGRRGSVRAPLPAPSPRTRAGSGPGRCDKRRVCQELDLLRSAAEARAPLRALPHGRLDHGRPRRRARLRFEARQPRLSPLLPPARPTDVLPASRASIFHGDAMRASAERGL